MVKSLKYYLVLERIYRIAIFKWASVSHQLGYLRKPFIRVGQNSELWPAALTVESGSLIPSLPSAAWPGLVWLWPCPIYNSAKGTSIVAVALQVAWARLGLNTQEPCPSRRQAVKVPKKSRGNPVVYGVVSVASVGVGIAKTGSKTRLLEITVARSSVLQDKNIRRNTYYRGTM